MRATRWRNRLPDFPPAARVTRRFGLVVAGTVLVTLSACGGTGKDAVDPSSGSQNGYVQTSGTTRYFPPSQRLSAPDVRGPLVGGGNYNLADQRGHVVVLNLWGSWCPDCRVEASDLQSAYQSHKSQGVQFVGVDIRDDSDGALAFMRVKGITYPSIDDPSSSVALGFHSVPPTAIPSTVVIDAQGRIAAVHLGAIDASELGDLITKASS